MFTRFIIYGTLGCLMEVFWTGLGALIQKKYALKATTSLWMFFIYGSAVFLEPVLRIAAPFPWLARGIIYTGCIFAAEYITGRVLKTAEICPWDYSGSRFHVHGLIRWDYAPAWFAVGLIFERVYWLLTLQ
jgi:uncharacterized membrane protein